MTKPKTLDQLRAEKERAETQLAQEQHKLERLENRKKYMEKTTYIVRVHFSQTAKETMEDKIKRLLREEVRRM